MHRSRCEEMRLPIRHTLPSTVRCTGRNRDGDYRDLLVVPSRISSSYLPTLASQQASESTLLHVCICVCICFPRQDQPIPTSSSKQRGLYSHHAQTIDWKDASPSWLLLAGCRLVRPNIYTGSEAHSIQCILSAREYLGLKHPPLGAIFLVCSILIIPSFVFYYFTYSCVFPHLSSIASFFFFLLVMRQ
ncbi:hypothetical protein QBC45DRAFT_235905 [Copromyces sp. CBS 386.78]|nr:hypothetical protein QBC45DRAFT_235905 [Copromyces sp. CBS 386.78]